MDERPCDCRAEYGPTCQRGRELHQDLMTAWQALHIAGFANLLYGWQLRHKDGLEQAMDAYCEHITGSTDA